MAILLLPRVSPEERYGRIYVEKSNFGKKAKPLALMNRIRIYTTLAAFCLLSQPVMAQSDGNFSKPLERAQTKSAVTSQTAESGKQTSAKQEPAKSAAKQEPANSAAKQEPAKGTTTNSKPDNKLKPVPTAKAKPGSATNKNQPALSPMDPAKLGRENAVMQAQAELEIKPDPVADIIFKAFHYITVAALGGSVVFGTMWYIRHKKRLASGFYDEEDDDEDAEEEEKEERTGKSAKSDDVAKEMPESPTPSTEENGGKQESKSDSAPQPVGSDESK